MMTCSKKREGGNKRKKKRIDVSIKKEVENVPPMRRQEKGGQ